MTQLITLHSLKLYEPDEKGLAPKDALFLKSSEGADWYQAQIHFSTNTRKIVFRENGDIVSQHSNVAMLWPIDMSITEILETDLPDGFPVSDVSCVDWQYKDGKVISKPIDFVAVAAQRRDSEMSALSARITALMEAQEDGDITEAELTELVTLRERRTKLRRLDLSQAPEIEWP
jgi:hypothetical protein